jgi:hypothetical protein
MSEALQETQDVAGNLVSRVFAAICILGFLASSIFTALHPDSFASLQGSGYLLIAIGQIPFALSLLLRLARYFKAPALVQWLFLFLFGNALGFVAGIIYLLASGSWPLH